MAGKKGVNPFAPKAAAPAAPKGKKGVNPFAKGKKGVNPFAGKGDANGVMPKGKNC